MEMLLQLMNSIYPVSVALTNHLSAVLKEKECIKKGFVLKAGQVCRNIYFIDKGLVRCYYTKGEKEICSWFMKEHDVIISVESFFQQKAAFENIQALEDCCLYYISFGDLQYMYHNFPEMNFIGRALVEKYYTLSEQRIYSLRMTTVREGYQYLKDKNPELILRVPSKFLASYIGTTEQSLSRIRGKQIIS